MAFTISSAARNAAVNAVAALPDAGAGAATIKIYTGSQPAGPDSSIGSVTLLATFTLNKPAYGSASSGSASLSVSPAISTTAVASGTAAWCRVADSTSAGVMDGAVTATGGGGFLEISTTAISSGVTLNLTGGTLSIPAS